ncbi:MAG: hypothetical protein ABR920_03625 [Terriglobales bacterium]
MIVLPYVCTNFQGVKPMISPEMIAATKMPDPVADTQFSEYTAASAVGLRTLEGTFQRGYKVLLRNFAGSGERRTEDIPTSERK